MTEKLSSSCRYTSHSANLSAARLFAMDGKSSSLWQSFPPPPHRLAFTSPQLSGAPVGLMATWGQAQQSQSSQTHTQQLHLQGLCLWLVEAISAGKQNPFSAPPCFKVGIRHRRKLLALHTAVASTCCTTGSRRAAHCRTHCGQHWALGAHAPFTSSDSQKMSTVLEDSHLLTRESYQVPGSPASLFWGSRGRQMRRDSAGLTVKGKKLNIFGK